MGDDEHALTIIDAKIVAPPESTRYDDLLARAALVADELSNENAFAEYHANCTENTHQAQREGLALFSTCLSCPGRRHARGHGPV